jgi:hypothetical protein
MANGADNRIITASGTDTLLAETYLTFQNTLNVSTLSVLSDQDTGDLFSIATTTHGATTLTTTDDDATAAHFEIAADGNITLDAAGVTNIESEGLITMTAGAGALINNASDAGASALTIAGTDVDQDALTIGPYQTTGSGISITGTGLTTGNAINVGSSNCTDSEIYVNRVPTATTGTPAHAGMISLSGSKSVNTASGATHVMRGIQSSIRDSGRNVGASSLTNLTLNTQMDYPDGTTSTIGIANGFRGDLADTAIGYESKVPDGGLDFMLLSSADTGDYCSIATTTHGATTLTTVDDDAAAAHFEIAADGNITLDAAGDIALEAAGNDVTVDSDTFTITSSTADQPIVKLLNTSNDSNNSAQLIFEKLRADDGVEQGQNLGEIWFRGQNSAQESEDYAYIIGEIDVSADGEESGILKLGVANDDGGNGAGLTMTGGDTDNEIDVTIGLGAASVTTVGGTLTMGSTATINNSGVIQVAAQTVIDHDQLANFAPGEHFTQANITTVGTIGTGVWQGTAIAQAYIAGDAINGDKIADDAVDSEHYTDGSIDTAHIADDQVTFAKALGVTPNIFDNKIKLIPSDFMANDHGGNTKFGVGYVETAGAGYGMRVANNATELYAFVSIPQGMTATHVDIFDKNDLAVEVFEAQINATTMTSKGSGNANTTIDITDVASTATNFLVIEVTTTSATNDKVYGGTVTIA